MRAPLKITGLILAQLSMFSTQVLAYLPEITFEQPVYQPLHVIGATSPDGWESLYGESSITAAGEGYAGGYQPGSQNREAYRGRSLAPQAHDPECPGEDGIHRLQDQARQAQDIVAGGRRIGRLDRLLVLSMVKR